MRGQGYDGAAAMSGRLNGAQVHIREVIPTALYVHYAAHSLNLAVSNSCSLSSIRNCMGTIASVYKFFNTPKRQNVLRKAIQCYLDYPAMLGNLFTKSWPDKKSIYRRVPTVHHLHHTQKNLKKKERKNETCMRTSLATKHFKC